MKIVSYKPLNKGFLQGICSVELPSGLQVREIAVFKKDSSEWITFPSRTYEKDGKKQYFAYLFLEAEKMKKFQNQLLGALRDWIRENPILAPEESRKLEEELPF